MLITDSNFRNLDQLVIDMKLAIEDIKKDPKKFATSTGSLYGATTKITDQRVLLIIMNDYLDCQMAVDNESRLYGIHT